MIDEFECRYLFRKISELKKHDVSKVIETDLMVIYEECVEIKENSQKEISDVLVDFYTSNYEMGGNVITMYSFVDEMRSMNRLFKKI